jgi:23S rRNA (guanosine2251-2'-O)-methyltransferase
VRPRREADEDTLWGLLERVDRPLLLVLDGVQDPHNLGACLRTADGAGVDAVLIPKNRAAGLTSAARKVAAGAAESVPLIRVTNLGRCLKALKTYGVWLVGAAGESGHSLYQTDLTQPLALVLGGEARGLRRLTREHCDVLAGLPMAGAVSSLNVSVAAAVCLYEAVRQRQST